MYLKILLSLFRRLIILRSPFQVILIFFTVHISVNSFASQTVGLLTHRTVKRVHIILVQTPPLTVRSFTVEAIGSLTLRCCETSVQEPVEIFF